VRSQRPHYGLGMAGDDNAGSPLPPPSPDERTFSPGAAGAPGAAETDAADGMPPAGLPPRPRVLAAVTLMLVGSALSLLGAFLPWWDDGVGFSRTGTDVLFGRSGNGYRQINGPGHVMIGLAAVTATVGILMLVIGRVLSGAIVAVIAAGVAFFYSLACLSIVQDTRAVVGGGSIAAGVPIAIVGTAATLAGAVLAAARRRFVTD